MARDGKRRRKGRVPALPARDGWMKKKEGRGREKGERRVFI
jgi:hypothetical protein